MEGPTRLMPEEWLDVLKVVEAGAVKHGADTWLLKDNISLL